MMKIEYNINGQYKIIVLPNAKNATKIHERLLKGFQEIIIGRHFTKQE